MELYILLLSFLAAVSGVVCQQAGNLNEMSALVSVLGEKPEYTALVDAMREIDTLQESGVPKKKITAALNALIKQVAFIKKYSSDADLDLVLVWCAARKGKSVAPSKKLSSSAAAYNGRSADDLALALSERPEYAELFELFVTVQVMIAQQSPLKKIRPHVFKLIERIQFVQKYASDEVLDEVMSWCYAQKGCSKPVMAGWKKALIGMAAAVFVLGLVAGAHKVRALRHGNGAHPDNGGVHDAAFAGGPGHHGALDGLAPHGGFYAAHAGGGGGGAPGPGVVGGGAGELPQATPAELARWTEENRDACPVCSVEFHSGNEIVLHIPDGAGLNVHGTHRACLDQWWIGHGLVDGHYDQSRRNTCVQCGGDRRFTGQFRSYVYPVASAAQLAPVPGFTSAERLRRGQAAMARMRAAQLVALEGAGEPVGPPATAGATAGVGSGPAGVVGGAGSDGGAAGAGKGPAVLEIVNGVQKLRVSKDIPIGAAQAARLLPLDFIPANTLVRFGATVAYILSAKDYQVLPRGVVVGPIDEYKVSNSRVAAPRGYTKVASFAAANDDEMFIYRQNAPTS